MSSEEFMGKTKLSNLATDENFPYCWCAVSSNITSELFRKTITVHQILDIFTKYKKKEKWDFTCRLGHFIKRSAAPLCFLNVGVKCYLRCPQVCYCPPNGLKSICLSRSYAMSPIAVWKMRMPQGILNCTKYQSLGS